MKYIYACHNKTCADKEGAIFELEIPLEAIMDENNIATFFCHRCGCGLIIRQQTAE